MTKIEIEKSEYEALVSIKSEAKWLQEKVTKLEDETKNKSIALDEAREKAKTDAKTLKTEIEAEKQKNAKILEKLWLKEWDDPLTKIDELSTNSTKYWEVLEKEKQERTTRINDYKTKLWEDFIKEKESLFDGLPEEKQEALLKDFITLKGLWDDNNWGVSVNVHNTNWWNSNPGNATDFDKLLASWADVSDLIWAMK